MQPILSVIVPAYNVEQYIEHCVSSLLEQTLSNVEYIFINDASVDNTLLKLRSCVEKYPMLKPNVTIIDSKTNNGIVKTRQQALALARGKYVIFCDSDDYVDSRMYEKLYTKAEEEQDDIVFCDFYRSNAVRNVAVGYNGDISKDTLIKKVLRNEVPPSLQRCIVKRELYHDPRILFPTGDMYEDKTLLVQMLYYSSGKIGWIHEPLYYHWINPNSISKTRTRGNTYFKFQETLKNMKIVIDFLNRATLEDKEELLFFAKYYTLVMIERLVSERQYYKTWKSTFPEAHKQVLSCKFVPMAQKIRYILTYLRLSPICLKVKNWAETSRLFGRYLQRI